ncbi:hypothetical protein BO71DRAFT_44334 [Aspergillus ellipticus CBS 707.79]|uniref:Uncharacterized protein n=1 Tax=Aspergillus ellipticus CBS 707.79 TaxID=1448320 RepID=A0A319D320_9EURO|nr:hypothetical protein BO71DRAFT_44334 [Aspergillus ellipticus CBS 707.79]
MSRRRQKRRLCGVMNHCPQGVAMEHRTVRRPRGTGLINSQPGSTRRPAAPPAQPSSRHGSRHGSRVQRIRGRGPDRCGSGRPGLPIAHPDEIGQAMETKNKIRLVRRDSPPGFRFPIAARWLCVELLSHVPCPLSPGRAPARLRRRASGPCGRRLDYG